MPGDSSRECDRQLREGGTAPDGVSAPSSHSLPHSPLLWDKSVETDIPSTPTKVGNLNVYSHTQEKPNQTESMALISDSIEPSGFFLKKNKNTSLYCCAQMVNLECNKVVIEMKC